MCVSSSTVSLFIVYKNATLHDRVHCDSPQARGGLTDIPSYRNEARWEAKENMQEIVERDRRRFMTGTMRAAARGFPYRDFTFRGSALVFAAATWKSRTPLLLVAVEPPRYNFTISLLSAGLYVRTRAAPPRSARKHRRRKTPDRRYNSEGTLHPWTSGRSSWKVACNEPRSLRVHGINDRGLGNCVFNLQASALQARTRGEN